MPELGRLLALQVPKLVRLHIAAGPALQRRAVFLGAVANVQAETAHAYQLGEVAFLLGLPDLIGSALAAPELDEITWLAAVCIDAETADRQAHLLRVVGEDLGWRVVAIRHLQSSVLDEFAIGNINAVTAALRGDLQRRLVTLRQSRSRKERQQPCGSRRHPQRRYRHDIPQLR